MMKLYARPASPFVRKVRVMTHEVGLTDSIEVVMFQTPDETRDVIAPFNPLTKIPVLQLEGGSVLYDSPVICEFLDGLHKGAPMIPLSGAHRWRVLRLQALGDGMGDAVALMGIEEARGDKKNESGIARQWEKVTAATQFLENDMDQLGAALNLGQIAVACALGYADFRLIRHQWRDGRPKLAKWIEAFNERPSMKATFFTRPNR